MVEDHSNLPNLSELSTQIKAWGQELGFQQVSIAPIDLDMAGKRLKQWLEHQYHGSMDYMSKHGSKRYRPDELVPGTVRVICVRMNYLMKKNNTMKYHADPERAYISVYARGRDYHKVLRKRLNQLCLRINQQVPGHCYRAFVDSAPVMEKALANASGLGWQGKHTIMINAKEGSWFFLGAIYTNLALPIDPPTTDECGSCRACIHVCPTQAIVAPYVLDARRCLAYLSIENKGPIPITFRKAMGNRIFGCDDCQLICPWNRYAQLSHESDFKAKVDFDMPTLLSLFDWDEATFLEKTQGSPIRRTGYHGWLRNIAVALGNAPSKPEIVAALQARLNIDNNMVQEHIAWAIAEQTKSMD